MPALGGRRKQFDAASLDRTARYVGRGPYAQLYAGENELRAAIHAVLTIEIGPDWWVQAVDGPRQREAARIAKERSGASTVINGPEGLYYLFLHDLAEIMRANAAVIVRLIPDYDSWIKRIEGIRVSRNVVGHMNFPTDKDRGRIREFFVAARALNGRLRSQGISVSMP